VVPSVPGDGDVSSADEEDEEGEGGYNDDGERGEIEDVMDLDKEGEIEVLKRKPRPRSAFPSSGRVGSSSLGGRVYGSARTTRSSNHHQYHHQQQSMLASSSSIMKGKIGGVEQGEISDDEPGKQLKKKNGIPRRTKSASPHRRQNQRQLQHPGSDSLVPELVTEGSGSGQTRDSTFQYRDVTFTQKKKEGGNLNRSGAFGSSFDNDGLLLGMSLDSSTTSSGHAGRPSFVDFPMAEGESTDMGVEGLAQGFEMTEDDLLSGVAIVDVKILQNLQDETSASADGTNTANAAPIPLSRPLTTTTTVTTSLCKRPSLKTSNVYGAGAGGLAHHSGETAIGGGVGEGGEENKGRTGSAAVVSFADEGLGSYDNSGRGDGREKSPKGKTERERERGSSSSSLSIDDEFLGQFVEEWKRDEDGCKNEENVMLGRKHEKRMQKRGKRGKGTEKGHDNEKEEKVYEGEDEDEEDDDNISVSSSTDSFFETKPKKPTQRPTSSKQRPINNSSGSKKSPASHPHSDANHRINKLRPPSSKSTVSSFSASVSSHPPKSNFGFNDNQEVNVDDKKQEDDVESVSTDSSSSLESQTSVETLEEFPIIPYKLKSHMQISITNSKQGSNNTQRQKQQQDTNEFIYSPSQQQQLKLQQKQQQQSIAGSSGEAGGGDSGGSRSRKTSLASNHPSAVGNGSIKIQLEPPTPTTLKGPPSEISLEVPQISVSTGDASAETSDTVVLGKGGSGGRKFSLEMSVRSPGSSRKNSTVGEGPHTRNPSLINSGVEVNETIDGGAGADRDAASNLTAGSVDAVGDFIVRKDTELAEAQSLAKKYGHLVKNVRPVIYDLGGDGEALGTGLKVGQVNEKKSNAEQEMRKGKK
jgi:hypothetical protein